MNCLIHLLARAISLVAASAVTIGVVLYPPSDRDRYAFRSTRLVSLFNDWNECCLCTWLWIYSKTPYLETLLFSLDRLADDCHRSGDDSDLVSAKKPM